MGKIKTSAKRRRSLRNIQHKRARSIRPGMGVDTYDPTKALIDEDRIGRAIWECLKNGDPEGVIEIIQIHLEAANKTQFSKEAHIPKTTLYHSFDFNITCIIRRSVMGSASCCYFSFFNRPPLAHFPNLSLLAFSSSSLYLASSICEHILASFWIAPQRRRMPEAKTVLLAALAILGSPTSL